MKILLYLLPFCLFSFCANAQSNVRAWYADGQVWVVWEVGLPLPETYVVFGSANDFTSTDEATQLGRLFRFEYLPAALKEQVDTFATYRIPDGMGGVYQLAQNEGLFVATPHQAGALYVAVVAEGETTVTPGVNITDAAVPFGYDPVGDPVECHLQATFPSPFAAGFVCQAYMMWCDGRQDEEDGRPDFPVMANAAKNGMPGMFLVSAPVDIDTTQPFPLTVWLHGGEGEARQSLAGSRPIIGINPAEGILVAHNDDVIGWRDQVPPVLLQPSWHFGWRKNWDPFTPGNLPTEPDVVVNYTQRRYLWIDVWLMRHFNIDPARININGHSMGGAGTTALAKCYPRHYASATIFNNGFGPHEDGSISAIFGSPADDFNTNLVNQNGDKVKLSQVWNIIDNTSPERDWPLMRVYHSKQDDNGTMRWDDYVVENYRKADSLGMGVQLYWSERAHGIDEGPSYNDHWHNGLAPDQQTGYDNTAYEEAHFRSDTWLPAFFNHRLDPAAHDPGDGSLGIGPNGSGDDWGTWGGYHRWENTQIVNECWGEGTFYADLWLEDSVFFDNDQCPVEYLISDLFIRNLPEGEGQSYCDFDPPSYFGFWIYSLNDNYSQSGEIECLNSNLIKINNIKVFRKGIRKVRLNVCLIVPTTSIGPNPFTALLQPNPVLENTILSVQLQRQAQLSIRVMDASGHLFQQQAIEGMPGENRILLDTGGLPGGLYFVQMMDESGNGLSLKMLKH